MEPTKKIKSIGIVDGVNTTAAKYYVDVRRGTIGRRLLHPSMDNFTTNGIFVYQEQVMAFLVEIAGYSWEEADQIRSAIAKKKHEVIMATFDRIREGCRKRGWEESAIETVCQQIQAFSRYSFNRSHSRAYSELGYITLYLKHHHPLEWWTATLNTTHQEDKLRHFVTIVGDMLSPPSLANTSNTFRIVGTKIVAPLSALKGIGPKSIQELVDKGPFTSIEDFCGRITHTKVNAGHFASIVKARAADCFMDLTKPYPEARKELLAKYVQMRNCKPFAEDLFITDPLQLFLQERAANQVFNKSVLDSPEVISSLVKIWPGLVPTQHAGIPLMIGSTFILKNLDVAHKMMESGNLNEKEVGFVLLYGGSTFKTGTSKKSGREWKMLKIDLSDGLIDTEGVIWDKGVPLKFPVDSLVFVRGTLRPGYKHPVSITISEISRIIKE